ncbi:hypothetical protein JTE90_029056 [Oedothorax gibbosus]|uniref:Uncharacterized protein n=1 Tax=Oedothorax gibbosus TaxID=931172 RepID=A0AAV6UWF6_9ARAC|nr:hypothetical protein JTE90_029056 [Oedothorax gibbosus]
MIKIDQPIEVDLGHCCSEAAISTGYGDFCAEINIAAQTRLVIEIAAKRDKQLEAEVLEWIQEILGEALPNGPYEEILRDGVILCKCSSTLECYLHPEFPGPFLGRGPNPADRNKREFTEDQLRMGETIIDLQYGTNKGANQSGQDFGNTNVQGTYD